MTITVLEPLSPPWQVAVTNRGPAGVGATIEVDPVVTVLEPGEPGAVVNTGNATHVVLEFSLPGGEEGPTGPAPIISIGDVTTGTPGNAADASIDGPDGGPYELNLTIPEGLPGEDGASAYVYVRYATDSSGTDFSATPSDTRIYMAVKTTVSPIASPVVGDFAGLWRLTKGEPGEDGADGAEGPQGPAGEVTASATFTDNVIIRADGAAKVIQPTGITIDDSNKIAINDAGLTLAAQLAKFEMNAAAVFDAAVSLRTVFTSASGGGYFRLMHNNAANALPASGDRLGAIHFGGLDGTTARVGVGILGTADGAWSAGTSTPGRLSFETTPSGSTTRVVRAIIRQSGLLEALFGFQVTGTIELDHASDTTIARDAAGRASIEGKRIVTAFTAGTVIVLSGQSSIDITGIDGDNLNIIFDGITVSGSMNLSIAVSTNNGSSFSTAAQMTNVSLTIAFGGVHLSGLRSGKPMGYSAFQVGAAPLSSNANRVLAFSESGQINAVRITTSTGTLNSGNVRAFVAGG